MGTGCYSDNRKETKKSWAQAQTYASVLNLDFK